MREGFLSWFGSYLEATCGVSPGGSLASLAASVLSLVGMAGSVAGGVASDRCFRSKRGPVALAYCLGQVLVLGAFGPAVRAGGAPTALALLCPFAWCLFGALTLLVRTADMALLHSG